MWQRVFARQHPTQHIDAHAVVKQLGIEVDEVDITGGRGVAIHRVVEQHIDASEGVHRGLDHVLQLPLIADIDLQRQGTRADFSGHGLGRFKVQVGDHYGGALLGKPQCRGAANATAGAGDHAHFAVQAV